jgi:hypothetical protein
MKGENAMLSKGNKIMAPAASIALLCFFTPWVLVSCENQPVASFTGWQLAAGVTAQSAGINAPPVDSSPVLFLILLAAIACLALVYFVYRGRLAIRQVAYAALGLAGVSLLIMLLKFVNAESQTGQGGISVQLRLQYGFWGTVLAQLAIIVGSVVDLKEPVTQVEPGIEKASQEP